MTSPAVVEVRVGDRTIRTFSSPDLPAGDRAAVWFIPDGGPTPVIGCRPGEPIRAQITFPAFVHHRPVTIHTIAVLPIDAHGAVIATNPPAFGGPAPSTLAGRAARSEGSPDRNPSLGIRIPSTRRPPA